MNTYELIAKAREIVHAGLAGFDDDQEADDWCASLESLGLDAASKLLARRHVELALCTEADALAEQGRRLLDRAKRIGAESERVAEGTALLLAATVEATGQPKLATPDGGWVKQAVRVSKAVEILDESVVADCFWRVKREVDKAAIGAALKDGDTVTGTRLVERTSTSVQWSK